LYSSGRDLRIRLKTSGIRNTCRQAQWHKAYSKKETQKCVISKAINKQHNHGLINYKDTKIKCRHLKKLACKGTLRQVFIRVYRLEIQSNVGIFDPTLCTLSPLTFSLVLPPPFPVSKYRIYRQCVAGRGWGCWVLGEYSAGV
jgi:hypothetical protein